LHARKSIVSDFNLDGKPDIFINCTGIDAPPFNGEDSLLLLSNGSGKYEKKFIKWAKPGTKTYTHGSSAADMNGDGLPDIVVTDNQAGIYNGIGVLINKGNGSFDFNELLINGDAIGKTAYKQPIKSAAHAQTASLSTLLYSCSVIAACRACCVVIQNDFQQEASTVGTHQASFSAAIVAVSLL
jgi:hypothetical protein